MLLATLLVLAQGNTFDLSQKISLDIRGGNGKDVAKALANATGIGFETRDAATVERYVIHAENQPLGEVMDHIANAEHGQWLKADNGFELRRNPQRVAETLAAHHAINVRKFKEALDDYRKQLGKKADFSDQAAHDLATAWRHLGPMPGNGQMASGYWEKQNELQRGLPVGRALMRIMLGFTPEQLADMSFESPTVFSTSPTAMQHQLPDEAASALAQLMDEQATWEAAVAKYLPERGDESWDGMALQGKINKVTTVLLTLQKWDESSGIQAQIEMANQKGQIVTQAYLFIQPGQGQEASSQVTSHKREARIPMSAVDVALAGKFGYDYEGASDKQAPLSPEARAIVANPEKVDPIGSFAADGLIALAHSHHESIAAVLDDRAVLAMSMSINKAGLDPKVLQSFGAWGMQSVTEDGGWLVMAEQRPDRADEVRCDRGLLHRMLDASVPNGRLVLDDAADYAMQEPHFWENPMAQSYLSALINSQAGRILMQSDRNLLRFYGSLDTSQRKNTDHLPLSALTGSQLDILAKILYGNNSNLQITQEVQPQQPDANGEYENFWNSLEREPTCSLGSGIPPSGYLKLTITKDRAISAHMHYGGWDQGVQTYDMRSLAWTMSSPQNQFSGDEWKVVGMRAADRTLVTFEFKYTDRISQMMTLQDVVPTSKETAFIDALPNDVRQELNKYIAEAKKQMADQAQNYPGGFGQVYGPGGRSGPP